MHIFFTMIKSKVYFDYFHYSWKVQGVRFLHKMEAVETITVAFPVTAQIKCACGKRSEALAQLGENVYKAMMACFGGQFYCSECDPDRPRKANVMDVMDWLRRVTACNTKEAKKVAIDLKRVCDALPVRDTAFGVAIVSEQDVLSMEDVCVSPVLNGKCFVLVQSDSVELLQGVHYKGLAAAEHALNQAILPDKRAIADKFVLQCKKRLLESIVEFRATPLEHVVIQDEQQQQQQQQEEDDNDEEEPEKKKETKKRNRMPAVEQGKQWLKDRLVLNTVEAKDAIKQLKAWRRYHRDNSNYTVRVESYVRAMQMVEQGSLDRNNVGPAWCANKRDLASGLHDVLICVPFAPPVLALPEVSSSSSSSSFTSSEEDQEEDVLPELDLEFNEEPPTKRAHTEEDRDE